MSQTSGSSNPFSSTNCIKTMIRNKQRLCWRAPPCSNTLMTTNIFHHVNNKRCIHEWVCWDVVDRCCYRRWSPCLTDYLRNFNVSLKPRGRPLPAKQKWHCQRKDGQATSSKERHDEKTQHCFLIKSTRLLLHGLLRSNISAENWL